MDPSSQHWFSSFELALRQHCTSNASHVAAQLCNFASAGKFAHHYLHSSGLFYGHVTQLELPMFADMDSWSASDKFKIALVEGLYLAALTVRKKDLTRQDTDCKQMMDDITRQIFEFYILFNMKGQNARTYREIYNANLGTKATLECVIDRRVNNPTMLELDFWKGSQFNIFASLDVVYFALWLENNYAYDFRREFKSHVLATLIAASNVSARHLRYAKNLVEYFVSSAALGKDELAAVKAKSFRPLPEPQGGFCPLQKKLLYEYAAFVCLVNEDIDDDEARYLRQLEQDLGLEPNQAQMATATVSMFLMLHSQEIFYLQYGESLSVFGQLLSNRLQAFVLKNKTKIVAEIGESKELVELIRKSRSEKLSDEEKAKVREQIFDLLKTIPSLALFMLPGGMIILPMLYKILPEEMLMPSSFVNKRPQE